MFNSSPRSFVGDGCFHIDGLMAHRMLEADATRMETDTSIGVAARSAIFQVAANGTSHGCQLTADLMMAPRMDDGENLLLPAGKNPEESREYEQEAFHVPGDKDKY